MEMVSVPEVEHLASVFLLESVHQFGPQKFKSVYQAGVPFEVLVNKPEALPLGGKRGESFKAQIGSRPRARESSPHQPPAVEVEAELV